LTALVLKEPGLARAGRLGFGASDRYPEMNASADANPPLCRAQDASEQLETAVRFILAQHGLPRLSLITHSWGSMPAGRFAAGYQTRSATSRR
jgi:pimeloyl-ACP methyl ester carboxylesterase